MNVSVADCYLGDVPADQCISDNHFRSMLSCSLPLYYNYKLTLSYPIIVRSTARQRNDLAIILSTWLTVPTVPYVCQSIWHYPDIYQHHSSKLNYLPTHIRQKRNVTEWLASNCITVLSRHKTIMYKFRRLALVAVSHPAVYRLPTYWIVKSIFILDISIPVLIKKKNISAYFIYDTTIVLR